MMKCQRSPARDRAEDKNEWVVAIERHGDALGNLHHHVVAEPLDTRTTSLPISMLPDLLHFVYLFLSFFTF